MILGNDTSAVDVLQLMEEASADSNFTPSDLEAILTSELETDHMLEYINAVVSRRMN
ncbi:MAG TPA: hypothetical protein VMU61_13425 [Candidatus Aquilonibacter sp.]|nr:hypothetical protein [Candidatus Aquilonibacter sp.]